MFKSKALNNTSVRKNDLDFKTPKGNKIARIKFYKNYKIIYQLIFIIFSFMFNYLLKFLL